MEPATPVADRPPVLEGHYSADDGEVVAALHALESRIASLEHKHDELLVIAARMAGAVEAVRSMLVEVKAGGLSALIRGNKART